MTPLLLLFGSFGAGVGRVPAGEPAVDCAPGQVQVLMLGTFHFAQQEVLDVLDPDRQAELAAILDRLAEFEPDVVTVEWPYARNAELDSVYQRFLAGPETSLASANEIGQIGFRLARRLGHERVYGVDVPMNLWHDSIRVFDEEYPGSRERLRARWSLRSTPSPRPRSDRSLAELIREWNAEPLPAMPEYGRFMPLVEGDVYAGALKLRPWYDRNMRIVQNFFRVLDESDDRLFLVIGGSHLPVLRHLVDMTPQLCSVDPLRFLP